MTDKEAIQILENTPFLGYGNQAAVEEAIKIAIDAVETINRSKKYYKAIEELMSYEPVLNPNKLSADVVAMVSEYLHDASSLEGVVSVRDKDAELGIRAGHLDKYLMLEYLAQLLERDEASICIEKERQCYLKKLLHLDEDGE